MRLVLGILGQIRNIALSPRQTYDMCRMWGISVKRLDGHFYEDYIKSCSASGRSDAFGIFFAANRLKDALTYDLETNKKRFQEKLVDIQSKEDYNIELYRSKVTDYYEKLIEGDNPE